MLSLQPDAPVPLVSQIVEGLRRLIVEQILRPGAKLPSIRAFAAAHSVSVFTVVEAYGRLVVQGWLQSRGNAGFFVKPRVEDPGPGTDAPRQDLHFDARWYLQHIFETRRLALKPGCGWLPNQS